MALTRHVIWITFVQPIRETFLVLGLVDLLQRNDVRIDFEKRRRQPVEALIHERRGLDQATVKQLDLQEAGVKRQ